MFTATWPTDVRRLASEFQNNPVQIIIGSGGDRPTANKDITQRVEMTPTLCAHPGPRDAAPRRAAPLAVRRGLPRRRTAWDHRPPLPLSLRTHKPTTHNGPSPPCLCRYDKERRLMETLMKHGGPGVRVLIFCSTKRCVLFL